MVALLLDNLANVHDLLLGHRYRNVDELVVAILLGNFVDVRNFLLGHWYRNLDELTIIPLRSALLGSDLRYLQNDNGWNRTLTAWNSERRSRIFLDLWDLNDLAYFSTKTISTMQKM